MIGQVSQRIRHALNSPWGDRLKAAFNIRPPKQIRPMETDATISDLFPWRVDDSWETRFDLMNLPALIDPNGGMDEIATVICFDADGREVSRNQFNLNGLMFTPVLIEELLDGQTGSGTFSVFHSSVGMFNDVGAHGAYLTERNYLAVRRRGDLIWNYVHGNTYALSKTPTSGVVGHVSGHKRDIFTYRPQLRFDDCNRFELIYLNPLRTITSVSIRLFDADRGVIGSLTESVPSRGLRVFSLDNIRQPISMIEGCGRVEDWRPVIIKHYDGHFDILHS